MAFLLAIGICALVSAIVVLVLDRLQPQASEVKLALIAGLLPTLVVTLAVVWALVSEAHHVAQPEEVDRGLVFPTMLMAAPSLAIFTFLIGFTAASVVIGWRRRQGPG